MKYNFLRHLFLVTIRSCLLSVGPEKDVTTFVTRQDQNGTERKDYHRIKRRLQDIGITQEMGETVAIASVMRNGLLSLLISGP